MTREGGLPLRRPAPRRYVAVAAGAGLGRAPLASRGRWGRGHGAGPRGGAGRWRRGRGSCGVACSPGVPAEFEPRGASSRLPEPYLSPARPQAAGAPGASPPGAGAFCGGCAGPGQPRGWTPAPRAPPACERYPAPGPAALLSLPCRRVGGVRSLGLRRGAAAAVVSAAPETEAVSRWLNSRLCRLRERRHLHRCPLRVFAPCTKRHFVQTSS